MFIGPLWRGIVLPRQRRTRHSYRVLGPSHCITTSMTYCTKVPQVLQVTIFRSDKVINNLLIRRRTCLQVGIHIIVIILLLLSFTPFCFPSLMAFDQLRQITSFFGHAHKLMFQKIASCRSLAIRKSM